MSRRSDENVCGAAVVIALPLFVPGIAAADHWERYIAVRGEPNLPA